MLKYSATLFIFLVSLAVCLPVSGSSFVNITTESAMRDAKGNIIRDCLEPHITKFGDTWYAYGFNTVKWATTCYSSHDLKTWTLRNTIPWGPLGISPWAVLYNSKNNEYVGFGENYGQRVHVYTSPSPTGPFTYHNTTTNVYGGPGDLLVFPDTDGKAYLIYNKYQGDIPQRYAYIYQLNDNYYDLIPSTLTNTKTVMEGFWMVKRNGTYFLFGSGLVGYDVDDNFYITAPTPLGPWTYRGFFAPVGTKTFASQTFQGLQVSGSNGTAYVYIGHRWKNQVNGVFPNATSIWLPLVFTSETSVAQMTWHDQWVLGTDGTWGTCCPSVGVTPGSISATPNSRVAFKATATDRFGAALSNQPGYVWTVTGGGTIDSNGLFTAGSSVGGPYTVTATGAGLSGTANVTVSLGAARKTVTTPEQK